VIRLMFAMILAMQPAADVLNSQSLITMSPIIFLQGTNTPAKEVTAAARDLINEEISKCDTKQLATDSTCFVLAGPPTIYNPGCVWTACQPGVFTLGVFTADGLRMSFLFKGVSGLNILGGKLNM
jgi:hypothetical protein